MWNQEIEWNPGKKPLSNFLEDSDRSRFPFKNNHPGGCVEEGLEGVEDRKGTGRQKDTAYLVRGNGSLYQNSGFGDEKENLKDP